MNKRGLLLRFIDVGLILLIAFIAISEIEIVSQIPMPGTDEQAEPQEERAQTLVVVQVKEDSSFNLGRMEASDDLLSLPDISSLEQQLVSLRDQERAQGNDIVVVIESDNLSQIQWTVDVLDLCDQYNIPKNINSGSLRL
ncbi:MAG: biopolymer transporter ExbD [Rhodothermaceae bacterium]|nr:biopolymer transporter ExbD [Rhodothermaceae bacterium]